MTFSFAPIRQTPGLQTGRTLSNAGESFGAGSIFSLKDIALAVPRATEGLVRGTVGLIDILPGVDTGVADEEGRFFGRSESVVGGLLEGAIQTLVPFLPIFRGLGLLAKGSRLFQSSRAASRYGRVLLENPVTRGFVAGGVVDFVAFGGAEKRFSNLIEQFAPNAVTGFLAADEDDPELLGRLKNSLEGAGLGAVFEGLLAAGKAFRGARKENAAEILVKTIKDAEEPAEKAVAAASEAVRGHRQSILEASDLDAAAERRSPKTFAERLASAGAQRRKKFRDISEKRTPEEIRAEKIETVRRRVAEEKTLKKLDKRGKELKAQLDKANTIKEARLAEKDLPTFSQAIATGFPVLEVFKARAAELADPAMLRRGKERFEELLESGEGYLRMGVLGNPRKVPDEVKAIIGLMDGQVMSHRDLVGDDPNPGVLVVAMEQLLLENGFSLRRKRISDEDLIASSTAAMQQLLDKPVDETLALMAQHARNTQELAAFTMSAELSLTMVAERALKLFSLSDAGGAAKNPELAAFLKMEGKSAEEVGAAALDEMRRLTGIVESVSLARSETGRTLRAGGIPKSPAIIEAAQFKDWEKTLGVAETRRRLKLLAGLNDLDRQSKLATLIRFREMTAGRKLSFITNDWFITNILWAPRTLVTNLLFPAATSLYVPFENLVGGLATANGQVIQRELNGVLGMLTSIPEAWRAAKTILFEGKESAIDPRFGKRDDIPIGNLHAVSPEIAGEILGPRFGPGSVLGGVVDFLGKLHQFPNTFMRSSDEFVKVMTAAGFAKSHLAEAAQNAGLRGYEVTEYVQENLPKLYDAGQLLTKEKIEAKALAQVRKEANEGTLDPALAPSRKAQLIEQYREEANFEELYPVSEALLARAREVTATSPLEPGTIGHTIQGVMNEHPMLRLIMPFVRTPTNILKFAGQRAAGQEMVLAAPFRAAARLFKRNGANAAADSALRNIRDLSAGGAKRSEAVGRIVTSSGIASVALWQAYNGNLTGKGPDNQGTRRAMLDAGWQPYSFRVPGENGEPDRYYQYLRADPFAVMLGFMADLMETSVMAMSSEDYGAVEAMFVSGITSMANNLTERTYLAGIRGFMDALSDPVRQGPAFVSRISSGLLGGPRVINDITRFTRDPVLNDSFGMLNKLRQSLPYLGQAPPVRNLFGRPIKSSGALGAAPGKPTAFLHDFFWPITYREVGGEIEQELATHQHGYSPPPRTKLGIGLHHYKNEKGQDAWDRWGELHGEVRMNGKTLKQALGDLIRRDSYRRLPVGSTAFEESPRVRLVRSLVSRYRERAWQQVLDEYPTLAAQYQLVKRDQRRLRAGQDPASSLLGVPTPYGRFLEGGSTDPRFLELGDVLR